MKNKGVYLIIPKRKQTYAILSKGHFRSRYESILAAILGVGVGIGVVGLYLKLSDGNLLGIPSEQKKTSDVVRTVAGLRNLGNNCFLNVVLQALASSGCFLSFLQNVITSDDSEVEEKDEKLPLTVALSSLLEELGIIRDKRAVEDPKKVMVAMSFYVSSFNLTREQDAAEALAHLLSSLEEEISECYVRRECSLADITTSPSKIYKPRSPSECKRWKQQFLGPFDGTVGSSLICRSCSSMLSLDVDFFRCLPLAPVLDREAEIMEGSTLLDCFRHFTTVEHLENYRCSSCWHINALKYLNNQIDKDEAKIRTLSNCPQHDFCNCKSIFCQEEVPSTVFSHVTKQLSITHCPKILCIHLQRSSFNNHGEPVKLQGHVSFPLLLNLRPFMQATKNMVQESLDKSVEKYMKRENGCVPQLQHINRQEKVYNPANVYRFLGENLCAEIMSPKLLSHETASADCSRDATVRTEMETCGSHDCSLDKTRINDQATSIARLNSSKDCTYRLSSVVEHYGKPGSGHYAVYRRLTSQTGESISKETAEASDNQWVYVSDSQVSEVSEEAVLSAEASLLFYDRIEA